MSAPKGNEYYRERLKHGRNRLYETADTLIDACLEYLEWCDTNPLLEEKAFSGGKRAKKTSIKKMRAPTIAGLCVHLGIKRTTWYDWKKSRDDLKDAIEAVEATIYDAKFTGAAAGLLQANIIARELGLGEKVNTTGILATLNPTDKTNDELKAILIDILVGDSKGD